MVAPISNRKRRANRQNASKSTGPRTPHGKATSSRNATSHGIFCAHLVLPGESHEIFHALRQAFILQQRPQNLVELLIVDRLVAATWKLRRLQEAELIMHEGGMQDLIEARVERAEEMLAELNYGKPLPVQADEPDDLPPAAVLALKLQSPDQAFERLQRYEQRLDCTIHRCLRELRQLRQDSQEQAELPESPFTSSTDVSRAADCDEEEKENTGETPVLHEKSSAQNEPTDSPTPASAGPAKASERAREETDKAGARASDAAPADQASNDSTPSNERPHEGLAPQE